MSSAETSAIPTSMPAKVADATRTARMWQGFDQWLVRMGDRLNPILVKETRQAIKSRQFLITFVLVLLACWIVTIAGVAIIGPGIFYSANGPEMFYGYYCILAFPLSIIVPFSAYRSLAAEKEDNTYELLSVSTLTPRQIVTGKLCSAGLQMLVFLSATAPCLAFTYLLRGIDVLTIAMMLIYTVLGSFALSLIGVFLATTTRERYGQIILSVAFIGGLFLSFGMALAGADEFLRWGYRAFSDPWFWVGNLAALTAYITTFALIYLASAAMLTFASDNRSTPLRIAMFVQQVCFVGWVVFMLLFEQADRTVRGIGSFNVHISIPVAIIAIPSGVYWYVMGAMMTAEWPVLSARVKRKLPQSQAGRMFLTWFNPGPGTGYMYVISNLAAILLVGLIVLALFDNASPGGPGGPNSEDLMYFLAIGFAYIVAYLGVGKLIVAGLRYVSPVPLAASVLLHGLLLAMGCGIPLIIHMMSDSRYSGYTLLQITNPIWSLEEVANGTQYKLSLLIGVGLVAIVVFCLNIPSIIREICQNRVALPGRILEDDAVHAPPRPPDRQSPWDDDVSQ